MSTHNLRASPRHARNTRTSRQIKIMGVTVDIPPHYESAHHEESAVTRVGQHVQAGRSGGPMPPAPVNVEEIDDEISISNPTEFEAAKSNSRRVRSRNLIVDLTGHVSSSSSENDSTRDQRRHFPAFKICDSCAEKESQPTVVAPPPPPPPPPAPPEPIISCPVCMGPFVEEVATKCGHVFCKKCIKEAISVQNKCPTCRKKVTLKELIRIYLPSTN